MQDIKKYEKMAKLELPDTERAQISAWANMLTEDFSTFADIDTDNTEPMYTALEIQNVMREDVSYKMISRDELLANAPMQHDGYFQVPKTV